MSSGLSSCAQVTENKEKMTPVKSYHASCRRYVNICKYPESKLACKWLLGPAVPLKQDEMVEKTRQLLLHLRKKVALWAVFEADLYGVKGSLPRARGP